MLRASYISVINLARIVFSPHSCLERWPKRKTRASFHKTFLLRRNLSLDWLWTVTFNTSQVLCLLQTWLVTFWRERSIIWHLFVIDVTFLFLFLLLNFESLLFHKDKRCDSNNACIVFFASLTVGLFTLLTVVRTNPYPVEIHQSCLCKSCIDLSYGLPFPQPSWLTHTLFSDILQWICHIAFH